jgi:hypothetical protein
MNLSKKRPAIAQTMNGPQKSNRPGSLEQTNIPNAAKPQAPSLLADTAGESDLAYFRARPGVDGRKRLAFEGEGYDSAAFISVAVRRDAAGLPTRILRAAIYGEWGRA